MHFFNQDGPDGTFWLLFVILEKLKLTKVN